MESLPNPVKKPFDFPINVEDIFSRLSLTSQELLIRSPVAKSILKPTLPKSKLAINNGENEVDGFREGSRRSAEEIGSVRLRTPSRERSISRPTSPAFDNLSI